VYQETYDRAVYAEMHTAGAEGGILTGGWKRRERGVRGGVSGGWAISPLYGLGGTGGFEALSVAAQRGLSAAELLEGRRSRSSLPRFAAVRGGVSTAHSLGRFAKLVQLVCAFRLMFPDCGAGAVHARAGEIAERADSPGASR